jgi:rubrerythrin
MVKKKMVMFDLVSFFLIFSVTAIALTIVAVVFVFKTTKLKSKKELQEKRMEIIDKHFNEMTRIECPYCKTLYDVNIQECPSCGASTKKILFPEIPS